jgi:AcrR family transcriptional regulator
VDDDRRERRSVEERRGELVDAAISIVAEEGLSNATTRRITDRAGVALGAFHYAFASKAELVAAVMDRISSRLETTLDVSGGPTTPTASSDVSARRIDAAARRVLDAHAELVAADPPLQLARQELLVRALRDPDLRPLVAEQRRRVVAAIHRSLVASTTAGEATGAGAGTEGTDPGVGVSGREESDIVPEALAGYLAATLDGLVLHRHLDPAGADGREALHAEAVGAITTTRRDPVP